MNMIIFRIVLLALLASISFHSLVFGGDLQFRNLDNNEVVVFTEDGDLVVSGTINEGNLNSGTGDLVFKKNQNKKMVLTADGLNVQVVTSTASRSPLPSGTLSFKVISETIPAIALKEDQELLVGGKTFDVQSETENVNYVRTYLYQENGDNNPITTTVYSDGLGREIQNQVKQSTVRSLTTGTCYNDVGLPVKTTKTIPAISLSKFVPMSDDALQDAANNYFPNANGYAYSEIEYYDDPLGRKKTIGAPGEDYSIDGNPARFWYFSSPGKGTANSYFDSNGFLKEERLPVSGTNPVTGNEELKTFFNNNGIIPDYFLAVTMDPDENISQAITDKFGRTVATRLYTGTEEVVSTFEYDRAGNIIKEVTPLGQTAGITCENIFLYNTFGEIVMKKMIDGAEETFTYYPGGLIDEITKAEGTSDEIVIKHEYDAFNRLTTIKSMKSGESVYKHNVRNFYDNTVGIESYIDGSVEHLQDILTELEYLRGQQVAAIALNEVEGEVYKVVDLYSYNDDGLVSSSYKYIPAIGDHSASVGWHKTVYEYDIQGKLINKDIYPEYNPAITSNPIQFVNSYDNLGRLSSVSVGDKKHVDYTYDEIGRLKQKELGEVKSVKYGYNIRDWVTSISTPGIFKETLSYSGEYSGNIKNVVYEYTTNTEEIYEYDLTYDYDGLDRLVSVDSDIEPEKYDEAFRYDINGRILNKSKNKTVITEAELAEYNYIGSASSPNNQLNYVSSKTGHSDGNYGYNRLGSMVKDRFKNMKIQYNWQNLAYKFEFRENIEDPDSDWLSSVTMLYDASGSRVVKYETNVTDENSITYYDNGFVYSSTENGVNKTRYCGISGDGRVDFDENYVATSMLYYLKDHLGSTRSVIDKNGECVDAIMYDAYGAIDSEPFQRGSSEDVREKFTGKEFDQEGGDPNNGFSGIDAYYFEARMYDPEIGIFLTTDPLGEFFNSYSYVGGNPILYVDPTGMKHEISQEEWEWRNHMNNLTGTTDYWDDPNSELGDYSTDRFFTPIDFTESEWSNYRDFQEVSAYDWWRYEENGSFVNQDMNLSTIQNLRIEYSYDPTYNGSDYSGRGYLILQGGGRQLDAYEARSGNRRTLPLITGQEYSFLTGTRRYKDGRSQFDTRITTYGDEPQRMGDIDGFAWKSRLIQPGMSYGNPGNVLIHPEGPPYDGTAGCIGIYGHTRPLYNTLRNLQRPITADVYHARYLIGRGVR